MDDTKREPHGTPASEPQRLRPQPVLDLKATELPPETPAAAEAVGAEPEASQDTAGATPEPPPEMPPPRAQAPSRAGMTAYAVPALIGAIVGAGGALAVAWGSGQIARDDSAAPARIAAIETQVRDLAARPAAPPTALRDPAGQQALQTVKELQAKVGQLEGALKTRPAAATPEAGSRIADLDATTKKLGDEIGKLRTRLGEIATSAQAARDTAMRSAGSSTAAATNTANEIEGLIHRTQALETAVGALQAKLASLSDNDPAARLAAVALALRAAVERSDPFVAELAAAKRLASDPARLKPLDEAAAAGIASAGALARDLSRLIVGMREQAEFPAEGGGLIDRLQAGASKLVRIRPVNEPLPPATSDPLAELETKAARADIGGAVAEAEKLSPAQRAPLEPWMRKARTRLAALDTARTLAREALAGLGAEGAAPVGR